MSVDTALPFGLKPAREGPATAMGVLGGLELDMVVMEMRQANNPAFLFEFILFARGRWITPWRECLVESSLFHVVPTGRTHPIATTSGIARSG